MSLLRVHCAHDFGADAHADLVRRVRDVADITFGAEAPDPAAVDVLIAGRPERRHLESMPRLRAVVVPWAGVGRATTELLAEFPAVALRNLHHNAAPTAEHAVALLLAAARCIVPRDRRMRAHDWSDRGRDRTGVHLRGARAVVLGFGAIGRLVAQALSGLGMAVTGVRSRAAPGEITGGVPVVGADAFPRILPGARALVVCVPLTDATEGLVGERELALLGPEAVVVNVARGPVVDERALFEALRDGRLHGAGLDVWWRYPREGETRTPPAAYPFESLDNVVMTPHCAGHCDVTESLRAEALAAVLRELAAP